MKKFAFVNDAAEREYKAFPKDVQQSFGTSLGLTEKVVTELLFL
jgi:hypothetical protein